VEFTGTSFIALPLFLVGEDCGFFSVFLTYPHPTMEQEEREVLTVNEFSDYITVSEVLTKKGLLGPGINIGIIIGCSSHSPVPARAFPQVVHAVKEHLLAHNVRSVWYGGDPEFRAKTRGGNITDILKKVTEDGKINCSACAVQRKDWVTRTPIFVQIIISYDPKLATLEGGKKSFGGYEKKTPRPLGPFYRKTPSHVPISGNNSGPFRNLSGGCDSGVSTCVTLYGFCSGFNSYTPSRVYYF